MFRLMEEKLVVVCRQCDVSLIEKISGAAMQALTEQSGRKVTLEIDQRKYLDAEGPGGVIVGTSNGKIRCDNTLETRLALAFEGMLPVIRGTLFGPNPNRKFFD